MSTAIPPNQCYYKKHTRMFFSFQLSFNVTIRYSCAFALLLLGTVDGRCQNQGSSAHAIQLPLSGRSPGGATVQQSSVPTPGSSVTTLNSQVQVQAPYNGSIPGNDSPQGAITLTIQEAVRRGLATNLGMIGADAASRQALAQRIAARSSLLPTVNAGVSENAAKADLAAEGFSASAFGATGFNFPAVVGPFHYYDARGTFQQNLLDFTSIHNLKSAHQSENAAKFDVTQAREEVVLAVTGNYLQLMATIAQIEAQRAEVQYAEASYKQARAQADAGNKAPIDANRNLVELQTEQQRLRSQLGDLRKQKNMLARLIGLPLTLDLQITEKLQTQPSDTTSVEETVRRSWEQRQDLRSAAAQLHAAEEARKAAGAEHLPTASVNGFFGIEGINPNQGNAVFQASATLNIPIFNGGRIHADIVQADAVVTQRRAELSSERSDVELDVRNAYIDLGIASDQLITAESNRKLALATLQQSQDRFAVGVADSVEVVNSQQALASADHDYISSLLTQNLAKVALAHAMGEAEKDITELFKGSN
jgi:outer membrane protein TolC